MKTLPDRAAPRFHTPLPLAPGAEIELPDRAAHHVLVLRLASGDEVTLFNGQGGEFPAQLTRVSRGAVVALVGAHRPVERESPLAITLAQCISSGDRMDMSLQKSTELGVVRIIPVNSERSIVRLNEERAEKRLARWRSVVSSACEQCGRNTVPEVTPVMQLDALFSAPQAQGLRLLLAPGAQRDLKEMSPQGAVTLLIGPEGGLSTEERARAEAKGYCPVRFGPRIMRTETAPLAVIAAMQALWGDC